MNVIITGATGMVGQSVLIECLEHNSVENILLINRSSVNIQSPKVKEVLHKDFSDFSAIKSQMSGYDACFHCMGVSSIGMKEEEFSKYTYDYTNALAKELYNLNPNMVFNYVSGTNTDSSEKGNTMWARVKGKTENLLLNMGFKDVYLFRAGAILPEKGVKSKTSWYNSIYVVLKPIFPLLKKMDSIAMSSNLGKAMINSVLFPQDLKHLENKDINALGKK